MNVRAQAVALQEQQIEESTARAVAARAANDRPRSALEALSQRLQVQPKVLQDTLRSTVFSACRNNEEFVALVVVSNEYGLNPLLKELYAFPAKGGGIVPMVSVDGWIRIMNEHPQFDGIEFEHIVDQKGNVEAIEAIIYRKDRRHPIKVIEYLEECRRGTDPWKLMPRRMLRNRALIQGARIAFGFSGIVAEGDEAEYEIASTPMQPTALPRPSLEEELNDGIPDFDKDTGEISEQSEQKSKGMTEVDEETARRLDAEQTAQEIDGEIDEQDEDEGEGDSEDQPDPKVERLNATRKQIAAAKNLRGLDAVEKEWLKHIAAYGEAEADAIDTLIAEKRAALKDKGGE